jgi:glycosyltransferase involved in cell wall biosynthesis
MELFLIRLKKIFIKFNKSNFGYPLLQKFFKENNEIIIIDDRFPLAMPYGFRDFEFTNLLKEIKIAKAYNTFILPPIDFGGNKINYGIPENSYKNNLRSYRKYYPDIAKKISRLMPFKGYNVKLAYSIFLVLTYSLLEFYETNKINFIFTLYPGGGFGIDNPDSDRMLEKIFASKYFRKVITTQKITRDYLIEKNLCPEDKIIHLFGGYAQFDINEVPPKTFYLKDKKTFDICFVALKYSPHGEDKGYDIFIDVAKYLVPLYPDMHFHVIGEFDENVIDISEIKNNVKFYGLQKPDFLKDFYSKMDIRLSPTRPFMLYKGNFDGFPLGLEALIAGVASFETDELNNNENYYDETELVITKPDSKQIIDKIIYYYKNLDKLYKLSKKGQIKSSKIFNPYDRISAMKEIIVKEYSIIKTNRYK